MPTFLNDFNMNSGSLETISHQWIADFYLSLGCVETIIATANGLKIIILSLGYLQTLAC